MNTQYFNYAIEIERTGSITKAAQNLYMAQPNLSKAMKELEEQLGYEIFMRTPGGMIPTEKGRYFLIYAHNILDQLCKMEEVKWSESKHLQQFRISIPRGSYIADSCMNFVAGLNPDYGMEILIQETNSIQAINNVAYERFNLGIIRYQLMYESYFMDFVKSKQLKAEKVWEFPYLVVMSVEHPLAKKKVLKAEELLAYIEVAHADLMVPYVDVRCMENGDKSNTKESKHIYVFDRGCQYDLLTRVPTTYMWVSPLPERYLKQYGLVQRACSTADNRYKDVMIERESYKRGKLDLTFLEQLKASRDEVEAHHYS